MNDHQKDILAFDKAIKANPNDSVTYYNRGLAKHNMNNYKEAILDFSQAIKLNPDNPDFYYSRGNSKRLLEDYGGAITDYTQAIERNPNFDSAYNMRGKSKILLKDYHGAIQDCTQAIELDSNFAYAYNNRGEAKYNLEDYQSAIFDFTKAIEINQDFDIAYNNRGKAKNALKNYNEAIQDYSLAIEIYPDEKEYYDNREESKFAITSNLQKENLLTSNESKSIPPVKEISKPNNEKLLLKTGAHYKHPTIDLEIKLEPLDNLKTNAGYIHDLADGFALVINMYGNWHSNVTLNLEIHTEKLKGHFNEEGWLEFFQNDYIADGDTIDFDSKQDVPFKVTRIGKQLFAEWILPQYEKDNTQVAEIPQDSSKNQYFDNSITAESIEGKANFQRNKTEKLENSVVENEKISTVDHPIADSRPDGEINISGNWIDSNGDKCTFYQENKLIRYEGNNVDGANMEIGSGSINGDVIELLLENKFLGTGIKISVHLQILDSGKRMRSTVELAGGVSHLEYYRD